MILFGTGPIKKYSVEIFIPVWRRVQIFVAVFSHNLRILCLITPYIRILDFNWLLGGVFFVYFHIGTGYEYDGNVFVAWVLQVRRVEVVTK